MRIGHARRHVRGGQEEGDKAKRKPNTNRKHHRIHLTVATIYHNSMHAMSCQSSGHPKGVNRGTHISPTFRLATECGGRGKGCGKCTTFLQVTYELFFILILWPRSAFVCCVFPNQISPGPARHMKGSIEPKGVPSNGIDNAIAQISFPAEQDVTIKHLRTNQT